MTRKDYELIAKTLNKELEFWKLPSDREDGIIAVVIMAKRLADTFVQDNPRFDREKFLKACGVE